MTTYTKQRLATLRAGNPGSINRKKRKPRSMHPKQLDENLAGARATRWGNHYHSHLQHTQQALRDVLDAIPDAEAALTQIEAEYHAARKFLANAPSTVKEMKQLVNACSKRVEHYRGSHATDVLAYTESELKFALQETVEYNEKIKQVKAEREAKAIERAIYKKQLPKLYTARKRLRAREADLRMKLEYGKFRLIEPSVHNIPKGPHDGLFTAEPGLVFMETVDGEIRSTSLASSNADGIIAANLTEAMEFD